MSDIDLETGVSFVTVTPTAVSDSLAEIPEIAVWFDVPNLGSNEIILKLKSVSSVLVPADCYKT